LREYSVRFGQLSVRGENAM